MLENQIESNAEIIRKGESVKIEAVHSSQSPQITLIPDATKDYLEEEQKQRRQEIDHLMAKIEDDQRFGKASKAFWYCLIMANLFLAGLFTWLIRK
jgi:hypothetical protein